MKIGSFYPILQLNSVYGIIKAGILLDTATGRFLSPDSVDYLGANGDLNSYNFYAYCSNNPIMYVDPSGHSILAALLITAGVGALLGGTIGGGIAVQYTWRQIFVPE